MFMKYSIVTRIYTEILINQAVDNFTSSRFRESRIKGSEQPRHRRHHNNIRRKGTPLCRHVPHYVFFAFADRPDQPFIDHHNTYLYTFSFFFSI